MKSQVIIDFNDWLDRAEIGYIDSYDMIKHKIFYVEFNNQYDKINYLYEFLINN